MRFPPHISLGYSPDWFLEFLQLSRDASNRLENGRRRKQKPQLYSPFVEKNQRKHDFGTGSDEMLYFVHKRWGRARP